MEFFKTKTIQQGIKWVSYRFHEPCVRVFYGNAILFVNKGTADIVINDKDILRPRESLSLECDPNEIDCTQYQIEFPTVGGKCVVWVKENKDTSTKEFLIPKTNSDFVCYDVEDYILNNQVLLEKICMATNKKADEVKIELHMYHLWLTKNEKYPFGKKAAAAGFESWLHNNKKFNNGTGNSKGSAKLSPSAAREEARRSY